ncbi:MAG: hypothetical protein Q7T40_03305 [Methylobacter sp.]|nr:hypothetical protein [Methylobacter sp.]
MNLFRIFLIIIFILCLPLNSAFSQTQQAASNSSDYPSYSNGILTLPLVDTDEQPGLFQNAIFQFDPTINAWHLQSFATTPAHSIFSLSLSESGVAAIVTNTLPAQVFLKVNGSFSDPCWEIGKVSQRLQDNHFEVILHVNSTIPRDGTMTCAAIIGSFEEIVPLQVYGLPAGTYEYRVNGEKTGTFVLPQDNHL